MRWRLCGALSSVRLGACAVSCGLENVTFTCTWRNRSGQLLVIEGDFTVRLTQTPTCCPEVAVDMGRVPW